MTNPDNNFGLAQGRLPNTPQISGIRPHSGTHDILTQRPAAGSFATSGRCVVLKELYVGCTSANVQGGVQKPFDCLVTFTSFDGQGAQNGVQKFIYDANDLLLADSMKVAVTLPPARVVQVDATILGEGGVIGGVVDGVGSTASGLYVDDVMYTQYDNSAQGVKACGKGF